MSIGNSGSFFNNFQNGFNFNTPNNPMSPYIRQNAPVNPLQNPAASLLNNQMPQSPLLNVLQNTDIHLEAVSKELAVLDEQQTIKMVKELLQMPKQFEEFISQLTLPAASKLNAQEAVRLLLSANINPEQISGALKNLSKDAVSNLYKMLAMCNQMGVSMKDEQIAVLSKLISFVQASSASDIQSLKTVMLMYLPWLPLTDPDAFKLEIQNSKGSGDDAIGLDSISVMLSTVNFGNIQSQILKTDEDGIKIEIIASETFPLKELVSLMQLESKKYNININFDLAVKAAFNKENNKEAQTKVFLNTSPGVNPFLLLISNALIKNTRDIDEKENKRWQEKEINENGKS